jgi:putative Holliday junction resolvase
VHKTIPQTLLAFDFGMRRIGVAVGQRVTGTATPLRTLRARNGRPDWSELAALVREWQPDALVIGLPLNMDGSEQPLTGRARQFGRQLTERYRLPVLEVDERLSTREAWQTRSGTSTFPTDGEIDKLAAAIILETWLHEHPWPTPT